jgi:CRISPR/Cas system-associated endonuclease Cas1
MLWGIDTFFMTRHNRVEGMLRNIEDDSHVKTRISQYEAVLDNEKCIDIAKSFVIAKIKGQSEVLRNHY